MKTQVRISVKNIQNEHTHFERVLEIEDSLVVPYDRLMSALLYLYQGLNVKVVIEQAQPFDR